MRFKYFISCAIVVVVFSSYLIPFETKHKFRQYFFVRMTRSNDFMIDIFIVFLDLFLSCHFQVMLYRKTNLLDVNFALRNGN